MPAPGGIVPPNLVPNIRLDLRTNQNAKGRSTANLSNKVDLCEWINYWIENGCIIGGTDPTQGTFLLYAENGLHKKSVDDPTALNAIHTAHLGGDLIENTIIDLYDPLSAATYQLRIYDEGTTSGVRATTSFGAGVFSHSHTPIVDGGQQPDLIIDSTGVNASCQTKSTLLPLAQARTEFQMTPTWWELRLAQTGANLPILSGHHVGGGFIEMHYNGSTTDVPTANNFYKFPVGDGNPGEYMGTDGAGNLSWSNPAAAGITAENGLYEPSPGTIRLGTNALIENTDIDMAGFTFQAISTAIANYTSSSTWKNSGSFPSYTQKIEDSSTGFETNFNFNATANTTSPLRLRQTGAGGSFARLDLDAHESNNKLTIANLRTEDGAGAYTDIRVAWDAVSFLSSTGDYTFPDGSYNNLDIMQVDGSGNISWVSPASSSIYTWGSGIDITGTTVDWNGALTQPVAIDGQVHAYGIAFNALDHFTVDTDSATGISLTQGPNAPGSITISNTSLNSDVTISSTNGGDITLNSTLGEYNFTTAPATDNTITSLVGLNGTNQLRVRDTSTLPIPSNTVTSYGAGNNVIPGTDDVALKSAITPGDTMTLPDAATVSGKKIVIKDTSGTAGASNITIDTVAGNIDGGATALINQNYMALTFISDGTDYWII